MRSLCVSTLVLVLIVGIGAAEAGPSSRAMPATCRDGGERVTKLTLIERLPHNPELLILGSSRARTAEPSYLERLTGRRGFNAAVGGGTAADAWVMTRYTAASFPGRARSHIWFVGARIATNGVPPDLARDPRARRYLGREARARPSACPLSSRYRADGSLAYTRPVSRRQQARIVARTVARTVAKIRSNPPRGGAIDPRRYVYFERAIAFMNRRHSAPVVVLNPIHPRVLRELEKYGFPGRKIADEYLDRLQERLDFVVVDCQDIRTWGGSAAHFSDASHVDRVNMRRMLRYVVAHSGRALAR